MTAEEVVRSLEVADDVKSFVAPSLPGVGAAFFARVVELAGKNPADCAKLASKWRALARNGEVSFLFRAKAVGERAIGRYARSVPWFLRAGDAASNKVDRMAFKTGAVDSLARVGRVDEAVELGRSLYSSLNRLKRPDLASRVALNIGNALLWQDRYREAKTWLSRAIAGLAGSDYVVDHASAVLGMSAAELYGGSAEECMKLAEEAARMFLQLGLEHFADQAAVNAAQAMRLLGRPDEALDRLLSLHRRNGEADGTEAGRLLEFTGDAYMELNLCDEAEDAFKTALAKGGSSLPPLNAANCRYGAGIAAYSSGDFVAAKRSLRSSVNSFRKLGNIIWADAAETALARIALESGNPQDALVQARKAARVLSKHGASFLAAEARLVEAEAQIALGRSPTKAIDEAARICRNRRYLGHDWKIHFLRAKVSPSPLPHFRRMLNSMLESRVRASSAISRTAFFRDKTDALSMYLEQLLAKPSKSSVAEAMRVIERTRSVTLIDEIVSARGLDLSQKDYLKLQTLRRELSKHESSGPTRNGLRRGDTTRQNVATLQRKWIEATSGLWKLTDAVSNANPDTIVYAETQTNIYALRQQDSVRLPISTMELERIVSLLEFEMSAPILDPDAPPDPAEELLRLLADRLICEPLLANNGHEIICPFGTLWRIPWVAVMSLRGLGEPIIVPAPAFGSRTHNARLRRNPKVGIWAHGGTKLSHIDAEVEAVLSVFPEARVSRTLQEVREQLKRGRFDLLHVACHAGLRPNNPMFSFLEFEDGRLTAAEIAQSGLRAEVVTLSACDTGAVSLWSRHEPAGLSRAFLARGAKSLLAAGWPLDDATAMLAMSKYYVRLTTGATAAEALADSRKAVRDARLHPYYWANYVMFGGYSRAEGARAE